MWGRDVCDLDRNGGREHHDGGHVLAILGHECELAELESLLQADAFAENHDCCLRSGLWLCSNDLIIDP